MYEKTEKSKSSARDKKILSMAMNLFYSQGIRATGVDLIISKSGVAKMTFYNHFPSKQKLVLEVLSRGDAIWFDKFRKYVESQSSNSKTRLLAVFDFCKKWFQEPGFRGCAFINTISESRDKSSEECLYGIKQKQKVAAFIEEIAKAAHFKDAKAIAEQIQLLMDGQLSAHRWKVPHPTRKNSKENSDPYLKIGLDRRYI